MKETERWAPETWPVACGNGATGRTGWRGAGRIGRGRGARAVGPAILGLLLASATVRAQAPGGERRDDPPSRASLTAFAGFLAPLADLTADPNSFGTAVTSAPAFGADAAFWLGGSRFGIGVQGMYAPADLLLRPTDFQGAVPTDLGKADYLAATLSLLYRLRLSGAAAGVEPYFGLGGGIRHLSVEAIAEPEVEDVTDPVGTLAAGTLVWVSRSLAIRFEVRDFASSFRSPTTGGSRLQNDVIVTVGLGTRIR